MRRDTREKNLTTKTKPLHQAKQKAVKINVHESPETFPQPQEVENYFLSEDWIAFQQNTNVAHDFSTNIDQSIPADVLA